MSYPGDQLFVCDWPVDDRVPDRGDDVERRCRLHECADNMGDVERLNINYYHTVDTSEESFRNSKS
jgi:hypothetical protein